MKHIILFFLLFVSLAMLHAKDITTKSGKTYKGYTVAGYSAEGLTILHSTGGVLVPLEDWPDDRKAEIQSYLTKIERRRKLIANRPDLTTKTGTVFKKYKILGFNASGARVSHWGGVTIVKVSELPDDIQKKHEAEITAATKPKGLVLESTLEKRPDSPFPSDMERTDSGRRATTKKTEGGMSIEATAGDHNVAIGGSKKHPKTKAKKSADKKNKEKDKNKNKDNKDDED